MPQKRLAIPLNALKIGVHTKLNCGSGFLVSLENDVYLVTAAHVPHSGLQQGHRWIVTDDWDQWCPSLTVISRDGTASDIPLFRSSAFGATIPRFGYKPDPQEPHRIFDVMWIKIEDLDPQIQQELTLNYYIFPIDATVIVQPGHPIRCIGYPIQDGQQDHTQQREATGEILQSVSGHYLSDANATPGYSGGPAVTKGDDLLGMSLGFTLGQKERNIIFAAESMRTFIMEP